MSFRTGNARVPLALLPYKLRALELATITHYVHPGLYKQILNFARFATLADCRYEHFNSNSVTVIGHLERRPVLGSLSVLQMASSKAYRENSLQFGGYEINFR